MSEESSIALQRYLEAEIQRRNTPGSITSADFLDILRASTRVRPETDSCYLHRVAQVAYERYAAESVVDDAPMMVIVPAPLTIRQMGDLLGQRLNYVVVFGAESIYFQDTVHALSTDAYAFGKVNVLGVHIDWLSSDNTRAERAIIMDSDGLVKETAFHEPVPIHIVQILHLPLKNERQLHRDLSIRFHNRNIPQINPYTDSAERADDKACTHALWEQYKRKIASPKYALILQSSSSEEIADCLEAFASDVVVQPNKGTEGYHVAAFHMEADSATIVKYIEEQILPEDDAIVRERRGNIKYGKTPLNVTFRVNVAWNGLEFVAESGYAQVSRDEKTFPASRGRGGSIVDINEALANLYYLKNGKWSRFIPADKDVEGMKTAATNAAYALNAGLSEKNYLKHMGIDVLLEICGTSAIKLIPVVLEANSRPAGLSQSSEIAGISYRTPRQQISTELFRFIALTPE